MTDFQRSFLAGMAAVLAFVGSIGVVRHYDDVAEKETVVERVDDKYVSEELGIKVAFPHRPVQETRDKVVSGKNVGITFLASNTSRNSFLVGIVRLPEGVRFNADAVIQTTLEAIDGEIRSRTDTQFQGFPAVEFALEGEHDYVREIVVDTPGKVVQLMVAGERNPLAKYIEFRDSLEIL